MLRRSPLRPPPLVALLGIAIAVGAPGCAGIGQGDEPPTRPAADAARWRALAGRIAAPWPRLQDADGRFRDYVVGRRAGFPERYGESVMGYALLQSGIRDRSRRAVAAGLRAIEWVVSPGGGSPRASPFETLALAAAYNLARRRLARHPLFVRSRAAWEEWLGRAPLTRLDDTSYYGNKHLVDAVAVLELLRTGLSSSHRSAVLGGARSRAEALARRLVNRGVPRLARERAAPLPAGRSLVLSDPPTDPLAYQALSLGMYARGVRLLGGRAAPAALRSLGEVARASSSLTAPDGDLAYFGRSSEQAWALPFTAYGAEVAAGLTGTGAPAEGLTRRALVERSLARLQRAYGNGPGGLWLIPALRADPRLGLRALDRYAFAVGYAGLTLMALNWTLEEMDGGRRQVGALGSDADSSFALSRGQSAFATVRRGDLWFAVKSSPPQRLGDLRYAFGLAAVKLASRGRWEDVMPLLPRTHGDPDSPGPVLLRRGSAGLPFGARLAVVPGGGVTLTGGFRDADGRVLRRGVTFRYEPRPCGVRVVFPARAGDRFEYSAFFPAAEGRPRVAPGSVTDGRRVVEFPEGARVALEGGYSSATEPDLVRARIRLPAHESVPLSVTICRGAAQSAG